MKGCQQRQQRPGQIPEPDEADIGLIRIARDAGQPVRFTVDAYEATGDLDISTENGMKILKTAFRRKASTTSS